MHYGTRSCIFVGMDSEKEKILRGERMVKCFDMDITMTLEVPVRFVVEAESSDEARKTLRKVGNDIVKGGDFKQFDMLVSAKTSKDRFRVAGLKLLSCKELGDDSEAEREDEREDPVVIEADVDDRGEDDDEDERDDERYVSPEDEEERTLSGLRSLRDAALKDQRFASGASGT